MKKLRKVLGLVLVLTLGLVLVACNNDQLAGAKEVKDENEAKLLVEEFETQMSNGQIAVKEEDGKYLHNTMTLEFDGNINNSSLNMDVESNSVYRFNESNLNEDIYYKSDSRIDVEFKSESSSTSSETSMNIVDNKHILGSTYYIDKNNPLASKKETGNVLYSQGDKFEYLKESSQDYIKHLYTFAYNNMLDENNNINILDYVTVYTKGDSYIYELNIEVEDLSELIDESMASNISVANLELIVTMNESKVTEITSSITTVASDEESTVSFNMNYHMYLDSKDNIDRTVDYDTFDSGKDRNIAEILTPVELDDII